MEWFYALDSQRQGPVDGATLRSLYQAHTIDAATLVWHAGLEEWKPFSEVASDLDAHPHSQVGSKPLEPAPEDAATCAHSGRVGDKNEMLQYGEHWLLPEFKDAFVAALQLGTTPGAKRDLSAMQFVGFWWRVVAYIIDYVILVAGTALCSVPFLLLGGSTFFSSYYDSDVPFEPDPSRLILGGSLFVLLFLALIGFYHVYLVGKFGATPGKRLLKFKIVAADGYTLSYGRATGRLFAGAMFTIGATIIGELITYFAGLTASPGSSLATAATVVGSLADSGLSLLPYLWVSWDKKKQALYDHLAGTYVVRD